MSKANNPIKVLRTALKRVSKGWTQTRWHERKDGQSYVCLEGAIFGFCSLADENMTTAQREARDVCLDVIKDRYDGRYISIPLFNDAAGRTKEEVMEVIKLGIIRLETADDDFIEFDPDEVVDSLLPS